MKLYVIGNNGPYPAQGGVCSSYLLMNDAEDVRILLDCGTGALAAIRAVCPPEALNAVVLSHLHYDHMSDLLPMQYALQFAPAREPLPVYAPKTPENVRSLLDVPCYCLREMGETSVGSIRLRFLPVRHPVETYAVRAECDGKVFVFTGDSNEVEGLADFCRGADLLLADAGLAQRDRHANAPHMSPAGCARLACAANAKSLLLTHFNPRYEPNELLAEALAIFPNTQLAERGRIYNI